MQQGWIKLHRSSLEHWIHDDRPFCRFGAWVDMLLMANHELKKFPGKVGIVAVEKGQLLTSLRSLSARWGWSKDKVTYFLNLLESDEMITRNIDANGTLVTIVNYSVYQDTLDTNRTQIGQTSDAERTLAGQTSDRHRTQIGQNKNVKNVKNEENDKNDKNVRSDNTPRAPKKKYGAFNHVALTDDEYNRLCVDYGQDQTEQAIDFLDAYIEEKGYKAKNHNLTLRRWVFDAVKERDSKNRNKTPQQDAFSKWGLTREDINT